MKIIPLQEALRRKSARQAAIGALEYHAWGACVHVGRLSPGCAHCFTRDRAYRNYVAGMACNAACAYCTSEKGAPELTGEEMARIEPDLVAESSLPGFAPTAYSFTGGGEPLLYLDYVATVMRLLARYTAAAARRPWFYLYTNGLVASDDAFLRLRDMGFDEVRFHLGASGFSTRVYDAIEAAVRRLPVVTVETPSWPPARRELFEMLPIIDGLGVRHLNVGEVEILPRNFGAIDRAVRGAEAYHGYELHLDDGGLVYDLIEEVVARGYRYSVLDCSSLVKCFQRGQGKWVDTGTDDLAGLFAEYR